MAENDMGVTDVSNAVSKLQNLSEERASKVLSLFDDLAELEALEDADDLKDAREALAEMQAADSGKGDPVNDKQPSQSGPTVPYDQLRREVGLDR